MILHATDTRLTIRDVARRLGVAVHTVRRWTRLGLQGVRLKPTWVGGRLFYRPDDVTWWQAEVDRRRNPPPPIPARERKRADRQADEFLRREGVLPRAD